MKLERVSEHIWSLKAWAVIPIRVWLVRDSDGVTLVDAGISTMARGILRTIERLNAGPLKRIILTHGHPDHVGALRRLTGIASAAGASGNANTAAVARPTSVPVYAHRIEIPYMEGDVAYPRRKKAQASVAKGLVEPLLKEADGSLQPVAGMRPYLTPGHSPGHVVYYHEEDRVLIGGDLLMTKQGQLRRPMAIFTGDMDEALRSAAIVQQLSPSRLEVAHAEPVENPADKLDALLQSSGEATTQQRAWPTKPKRTL